MKAWQIVDWNERHENHETRKLRRGLRYVPMPNFLEMPLWNRLMRRPNGNFAYTVYSIMVMISGRRDIKYRGWLVDATGRPLSLQDMADTVNSAFDGWEAAIESLELTGWIRYAEMPSQAEPDAGADGTLFAAPPPAAAPAPAKVDAPHVLRVVPADAGRSREVPGDRPVIEPDTGPDPVKVRVAQRAGTGTGTGAIASRMPCRNRAGLHNQRPDPTEIAAGVRAFSDAFDRCGQVGPAFKTAVERLCALPDIALTTQGQAGSLQAWAEQLEAHEDPPRAAAELQKRVKQPMVGFEPTDSACEQSTCAPTTPNSAPEELTPTEEALLNAFRALPAAFQEFAVEWIHALARPIEEGKL